MKEFLKKLLKTAFILSIVWAGLRLWNVDKPQREAEASHKAAERAKNTPPPLPMSETFVVTSSNDYTVREIRGRNLKEPRGMEVNGAVHVYYSVLRTPYQMMLDNPDSIYYPGPVVQSTIARSKFRDADEILFRLPKYYPWWDVLKNNPLPDQPVTVRLQWE